MAEEYRRLLDRLNDTQLQAIALWKVEGYTNEEIATRLGVSFRIVRRDFEKSYGKLRRELDDELTRALQHGRD